MSTDLTVSKSRPISVFSDMQSFEDAQRIAKALIHSDLVPTTYRGEEKMGNALIAMDLASRIGVSAMVVMQNLHIIEGRPSWSSPFIISALNSSGLFSPLRFKLVKLGEREVSFDQWEGPKGNRTKVTRKVKVNDMTCVAMATEKATGEILEGPEVSIAMAVAEGWYTKPGSKWVTMPELMIRYRAAAFFGRLYAPDIMNGMATVEEMSDVPEMRDVTPVQQAATVRQEDTSRPAGRAKGVHAAMSAGKASKDKAKPEKAALEPKTIDGEIEGSGSGDGEGFSDEERVDVLQTDGDADVFGGPDDDDDDYNPA